MMDAAKNVAEVYSAFIHAKAAGLPEEVVRMPRRKASARPAVTTEPLSNEPVSDSAGHSANDSVQSCRPSMPPPPKPKAEVVFDWLAESSSFGTRYAEIIEAKLTAPNDEGLTWIQGDEEVKISVRARAQAEIESPIVGFIIKDRLGQPILGDNTFLAYATQPFALKAGEELVSTFIFRLPWLLSGRYSVTVALASGTLESHVQHHWVHDALFFDVHSPYNNGVMIAVPMKNIRMSVSTYSAVSKVADYV
jgi:lipopolysaccharide transport system ATP-binding protein